MVRAMTLGLVVMVLLAGCSGARGKESRPPHPEKAEPCNTVDAGGADAPASSYYQIGTCPEDESEH